MVRTLVVLILIGLLSCRDGQPPTIISPKEKVQVLSYQDFLSIQTDKPDTIEDLNSFLEIGSIWAIGADNGVYLIDNHDQTLKKYFKFDIKSHFELFDGQDSIVGFSFVELTTNQDNSKLLVQTSNGIVFQINLVNNEIEWLVKFINRIETATYSHNDSLIAIGTGYNYKTKDGQSRTEYYASLFLIDSKTGQFLDHFNENASVKKILFQDDDSKLLVAYDWNYTDSYLWDINQKGQHIAQFEENQAFLYDIAFLNESSFVTVNGNGISKWEIPNPDEENLIFIHDNHGNERVLQSKLESHHLLFAYSKCFFFDQDFLLLDSLDLHVKFENAQYSSNDSIVILQNLSNNHAPHTGRTDSIKGFYYFNIWTKEFSDIVTVDYLNEIIKA